MVKNKKHIIAAVTLALSLTIGSTVFASEVKPTKEVTQQSKEEKCKDGKHHKGGGFKKVFEELGITKEDINEAKKSGKTIFDLAKEKKNMTPDQVRALMLKSKTEAINKRVSEGKLTKEKGDEIIAKSKERIEKWDGKFKEHKKVEKQN